MASLLAAILLWGFLHSLLASRWFKRLVKRKLGDQFMRSYRLLYNIFSIASFSPVLLIAARITDQTIYVIPIPWSIFLFLGQAIAVVVLIIAFLQTDVWEFLGMRQLMSRNLDNPGLDIEESPAGQLITEGLYRYMRHPLYTAGIVFIWLMPVMTRNVLMLNLGLTAYVIIGAVLEERKLRRDFGQKYLDYSATTPMFFPSPFRNKRGPDSST